MYASKSKMQEMDRLKKRSDFLRAQKSGQKWVSRGLILIAAENGLNEARFGLTVTKKLEKSAVRRNRMKRRLRAVAYDVLPNSASHGMDYIIIARRETAQRLYKDLQKDLLWCLGKLGYEKSHEN